MILQRCHQSNTDILNIHLFCRCLHVHHNWTYIFYLGCSLSIEGSLTETETTASVSFSVPQRHI